MYFVYLRVGGNIMKNILYLIFILTISCNSSTKQTDLKTIDTTKAYIKELDKSKFYTAKDTLIITTETNDTLKFSKEHFNEIIDRNSELYDDAVQDPDLTYMCNENWGEFSSEVGQDVYFVLYAYFLKQKNGIDSNKERRQKLIYIYSKINSLFGHFEYGGTYFGHQSSKLLGYVEYSIYLYLQNKQYGLVKTYDISKQKKLYINSLRQLILDESKIDFNSLGQEKLKRNKELNKIVDELDKLITDNFYLRRTQEFHFRHYEYY